MQRTSDTDDKRKRLSDDDMNDVIGSKHIPVHFSTRASNDDGFSVTRRRTKRFCVLGLSNNVNVDVLTRVVNRKGPTVTNVAVFPLRNNPTKVLLSLNVHADR